MIFKRCNIWNNALNPAVVMGEIEEVYANPFASFILIKKDKKKTMEHFSYRAERGETIEFREGSTTLDEFFGKKCPESLEELLDVGKGMEGLPINEDK